MAGCETAVSNIVMSCVVFLTLEFITPLFKYTPNAILASIIINAVIGLIDIGAATLIWKIDKFDFVACMGAFFGVVFSSVEIGLLIAVRTKLYQVILFVKYKLSIYDISSNLKLSLCCGRSLYHLPRFSYKLLDLGQQFWERFPGQLCTETFNNILKQLRFQVF